MTKRALLGLAAIAFLTLGTLVSACGDDDDDTNGAGPPAATQAEDEATPASVGNGAADRL